MMRPGYWGRLGNYTVIVPLLTSGPDQPGGILPSGHTDEVSLTDRDWTTDPFQMTERGGRLYGRGTCDMKGFIAAALAYAKALETTCPSTVLFRTSPSSENLPRCG